MEPSLLLCCSPFKFSKLAPKGSLTANRLKGIFFYNMGKSFNQSSDKFSRVEFYSQPLSHKIGHWIYKPGLMSVGQLLSYEMSKSVKIVAIEFNVIVASTLEKVKHKI